MTLGDIEMDEKDFLKQIKEKSLSPDAFNHRGHLWLGWLYIRDNEFGEASRKLNRGIKDFAESLGAGNKYHHTLTTTFACAIKSRFKKGQSFDAFLLENQDLENDPMSLIASHYSPERLHSSEAKQALAQPDRDPFPIEYETQLKNC